MILVGRIYVKPDSHKMQIALVKLYCKTLLIAVMIWILNLRSYSQLHVQSTLLSVTGRSKVNREKKLG